MRSSKLFSVLTLGLIASGAIASSVSAQTIPALSRTAIVDGKAKITVFGSPRTQALLSTVGLNSPVVKSYNANACGFVRITNANAYAGEGTYKDHLGATKTINPRGAITTQTPQAIPTCNPTTGQMSFPLDNFAITPLYQNVGGLMKVSDTEVVLYTQGNITNRVVDFTFNDNETKQKYIPLNACGIGSLNITGAADVAASNWVGVNGAQPSDISTLPLIASGIRCIKDRVYGTPADFTVAVPDVYKNDRNDIFIKTAANQEVNIGIAGIETTRSVTSDRCGGITLGSTSNPQTTAFTLDSESFDPSTMPTALKPSCKKNATGLYAYDVEPTGNFKTAGGQVFIKSTTASPSGFGDRRILTATVAASSTKKVIADKCGIAKLTSSASNPYTDTTSFTYGGNPYTVGSLPVNSTACQNTGTTAAPNYELFTALN